MRSVLAVALLLGWALPVTAALAQDSSEDSKKPEKGGDVASTDNPTPVDPKDVATGKVQFSRRSKDNDAFYDAIANMDVPSRYKAIPWLVSLPLVGLVVMVGMKTSYRNRFEG
jgi:hypothetical protein